MPDATLRLLDSLRAASDPDPASQAHALEAFVCLLLGKGPERLTIEEGALAAAVLEDALAPGGIVLDDVRARPFRIAFRAVAGCGEGEQQPRSSGSLALEGLFALPRTERAALALSCVVGLRDDEIGMVIGTDAARTRAIVETSIARLRAEARRGVGRLSA